MTQAVRPFGLKCGSVSTRRNVIARVATTAPLVRGTQMSGVEMFNGNKRLQTQVQQVTDDTITIRSLDWDRDRFDIEFALQEGTTYNSYLIFGEKTALVDTSHEKFRGLYLKTLKKQLEAAGRTIDYIFVSHTEPDHSGLIPDVVDMFPDVVVVGSKVALQFLSGLVHTKFQQKIVKGGDKIDLGNGHEIEFVMAPNLHWPDTMFAYDHATGVMYTCDAFGSHYCTEDAYDSQLDELLPHYRFYYDCLMKPNSRSVLTALRKVKDIPYRMIATGHGPMIKYNLDELVGDYAKWSKQMGAATASVAVLYCSEYGYGDRLSQTIARGITKSGVATEMVDMLSVDPAELRAILGKSAGVVIMSPPHESKTARESLAIAFSELTPKQKVVIAECYGGDDEPVDTLLRSVLDVGATLVTDPLRLKDVPKEKDYQAYEETGTDLAQALNKKEAIARQRAMSPAVAKAMGRLSSGLYIVTARHDDGGASSAMVASWVAQASFEPLGFTVAVAKDRAIESLMQVNDDFVLNVLGEDNYGKLMKHFLQRFAPGADRFEGIRTFAAQNGSPVLQDAIAYLECRVVSRMETADHWVTYCEVTDGSVVKSDVKTAVHRRKVGNYY